MSTHATVIAVALVIGACEKAASRGASPSSDSIPASRLNTPAVVDLRFRKPDLAIGASAGLDGIIFERIVGVVMLGDRRVVVADQGLHQLMLFSSDGQLLKHMGQKGRGPGEFDRLANLWRGSGDTIIAYDDNLGRVSFFDSRGEFVEAVLVRTNRRPPVILGRFTDGQLLGYWPSLIGLSNTPSRSPNHIVLRRFDIRSPSGDSLLSVPDNEYVTIRNDKRVLVMAKPLGRRTVIAVSDSAFAVGTQETLPFSIYSRTGKLIAVVKQPYSTQRLTEEDVLEFKNRLISRTSNPYWRTRAREILEAVDLPEEGAAYGNIQFDDCDHLWIEESEPPYISAKYWIALDKHGSMLSRVHVPSNFRPLAFGRTYLLGVRTDQNELESLELHRLDLHSAY